MKAQAHARYFPLPVTRVALLNYKMSASIEVAKDPPSEAHFFDERSIYLRDPVGLGIDQ